MRTASILVTAALLSGCVTEKVWIKPGASQDDFVRQRYACMQQSQQQVSVASIGRYGGVAQSGQNTNAPLFNACMSADGWSLMDKGASDSLSAAASPALEDGKQLCSRPDLQELFKKIPCLAAEVSPDQMADRGKITPAERDAFLRARQAAKDINVRIMDAHRHHNPATGPAIVDIYERTGLDLDRLAAEYSEGRISRGEYNKRRLDINRKQIAEMQKATVR